MHNFVSNVCGFRREKNSTAVSQFGIPFPVEPSPLSNDPTANMHLDTFVSLYMEVVVVQLGMYLLQVIVVQLGMYLLQVIVVQLGIFTN